MGTEPDRLCCCAPVEAAPAVVPAVRADDLTIPDFSPVLGQVPARASPSLFRSSWSMSLRVPTSNTPRMADSRAGYLLAYARQHARVAARTSLDGSLTRALMSASNAAAAFEKSEIPLTKTRVRYVIARWRVVPALASPSSSSLRPARRVSRVLSSKTRAHPSADSEMTWIVTHVSRVSTGRRNSINGSRLPPARCETNASVTQAAFTTDDLRSSSCLMSTSLARRRRALNLSRVCASAATSEPMRRSAAIRWRQSDVFGSLLRASIISTNARSRSRSE